MSQLLSTIGVNYLNTTFHEIDETDSEIRKVGDIVAVIWLQNDTDKPAMSYSLSLRQAEQLFNDLKQAFGDEPL